MIRAFVAIRPPDDVCETLEELQADLSAGRAVAFENLHLSLAFLGQHPAPVLADFADDLARIHLARIHAAPFALTIDGVGVFGDARPRSAHAVVAPDVHLTALRGKIARAAEQAGLGDGRKFVPHITLARFNGGGGGGAELRDWLARYAGFRLGPFPVADFALYRSELTRSGPAYTQMARFPL